MACVVFVPGPRRRRGGRVAVAPPQGTFRLPADAPADALPASPVTGGRWVVDGWRASTWLPGTAGPAGRWNELLVTARAFTAAVAHLPRPSFLDERTHPWAVADRAAWDEQSLPVPPEQHPLVELLRALAERHPQAVRPAHLVHGDLSGNVLFHDDLPPAVIDVSPYWRPAAYAGAVAVADGLLWWGQSGDLVRTAGESGDVGLVARAVLFRLLTHVELTRTPTGATALPAAEAARFERAAHVLRALAT